MTKENEREDINSTFSHYGMRVTQEVDFTELGRDIYELKSQMKAVIRNTRQTEDKLDYFTEHLMATRTELNSAIERLNSVLITETSEIRTQISSLQNKIEELNIEADFSPEIERLNRTAAALESIIPSQPQAPITPEKVEEILTQDPLPPGNEPVLSSDDLPKTIDDLPSG